MHESRDRRVSVAISVDAGLIGTGVAVGVVSAAPDLANIGFAQINNPPDGLSVMIDFVVSPRSSGGGDR
jgi:hypothetical protein